MPRPRMPRSRSTSRPRAPASAATAPPPPPPNGSNENARRLAALHADPRHWSSAGLLYLCADDERLWVPKRAAWMGWTINLARTGADWAVVALLVGAPLLAAYFAK